ncbi:MAG: DUF4153 domain-containing protein [Synergistaceae bacterium]|nr:DUF4153 domain-containing protein [Synergistaceae bacterium]
MTSLDKKRYFWVIFSALLQGLLLGIYVFVPSGPLKCMPLTVIFLVPFVFWLSQEHWGRRLFELLGWLTLALIVLWLYRLWSIYSPGVGFYYLPSQISDLIRVSMAVFLLIPFFQCRIASWSWKISYSEIFFQLCRNLFLLFQAAIVIAVFWGLLVTAGLLFDIVGLDVVPSLIFNPATVVLLSCVIIAISISVAIKHPGIDSLGRWILSVLAWLLPFFSILSGAFLLCLPYYGLKTLWSTGQASTLMLLLQFGTIILANACWLDGTRSAFRTKSIDILAQISLLCLPIYMILCLYSVGLRVAQYGLSTDRIQAFFLALITGIVGLGYAGAVLFRKWPDSIGRVNIVSVIIMTLIIILMNSPLLDPYRLAAYNQADRLHSGQIKPEDFDYIYTRFNLGRYGNKVLSRLSEDESPEIKSRVNAAMSLDPAEYLKYVRIGVPPVSIRREIISGAKVYPDGAKLSEQQINLLVEKWPLEGSAGKNDIAFVFISVVKGGNNLILFTENSGIIYDLDLNRVGTIAGKFNLSALAGIKAVESNLLDIDLNGNLYQINK